MSQSLQNRNVVLGVTGGIAAYKSADLVRRLRDAGAEVRVVMTPAACEFVTPLTFQAVSGNPVHTSLLDEQAEAAMGHIELARWADVVLVAPATADFLAKLAQGRADDLLSTLCLATRAPLLVAPAMNSVMWENRATQDNVALLVRRGVRMLGPGVGDQACAETGYGRMLEPLELVEEVSRGFGPRVLDGVTVMITAGPTREHLDPVRFISNRSSGQMGYAMAAAARTAGADVLLVSGPVRLAVPEGVEYESVESAVEMHDAVMARIADVDIFIGVAAVADYRPVRPKPRKIKKDEARLDVSLERNPDILRDVASRPNGPFTVGFAAETHDLEANALDKLQRKRLDMIAANLVARGGLQDAVGFDASENALEVFWPGGQLSLERGPKTILAKQLVELIARQYRGQHPVRPRAVS
ncbi:MAG: bifunctional phosphopantothenoylcysteine decarboxylase/phosphopantothenate--cysteine ligase CoaBC [Gammaproteobacteria bacterium]|nr:MAG: bifunctional phosphopantothenoylcysteine decarboxylase/phosphopantothenate--cysteine ligase CoaBC [Gammaproteobacteria bacterium]